MTERPVYFHLPPGHALPSIEHLAPFRAVVLIEGAVSSDWRADVSDWLVRSGCLYMMAGGLDCGLWDDSVDAANIEAFDFKEIPENRFVITTWHDDSPLSETFDFCKRLAVHPALELPQVILLHIALGANADQMLRAYADA